MKPYKSMFKEEVNNATQLAEELLTELKKIFPRSYWNIQFSSKIYPSIGISFALGKDKSEWANGIFDNDNARQSLRIGNFNDDGSFKDSFKIEGTITSVYVKPRPEDKYMAYSRIKTPWRNKTVAKPEQVIDYLKKYFISLKKLLGDHIDEMVDPEFVKSKI